MESYNDANINRAIIMDNYEHPDKKVPEQPTDAKYKSFNNNSESCIDNLTVYIKEENGVIVDAVFSGIGCAVSTASTNIFCNLITNKTLAQANAILDNYKLMINGESYDAKVLEDLNVFSNVNKQANRIKCALIGCDAINHIIKGNNNE